MSNQRRPSIRIQRHAAALSVDRQLVEQAKLLVPVLPVTAYKTTPTKIRKSQEKEPGDSRRPYISGAFNRWEQGRTEQGG